MPLSILEKISRLTFATPLLLGLAACPPNKAVDEQRTHISTKTREVLYQPSYEEIMSSIEDEIYGYQQRLIEGDGGIWGKKADPHAVLALGDIEIQGQNLLEILALEQLSVYFKDDRRLYDMSKHTGDAINILIRSSNMDFDRKFEIELDDDKIHEPGKAPRVSLTLREIIKRFLRTLPRPSIYGTHKHSESRPDEWVLLLLAYSSQDEELNRFIKTEMRYRESPMVRRYKPTHAKDYVEGTETEWESAESVDSEATCLGMHDIESLLVYATFTHDEEAARDYLDITIQILEELNGNEELTTEEFFRLSHIMDTLGQIASMTIFSDHEIAVIQTAFEKSTSYLNGPNRFSGNLHSHGIGMLAHFYVGAKNLHKANVYIEAIGKF